KATIEIIPKTFSPDGDGVDDAAFIHYQAVEPGFVASVTIYDSNGRPVRSLVHNQTLGLKGSWSWDGLDAKGQKLPIGIYIIYTELFNLQGKREQFKNTVVLARRFN
ncbi:MAG: gliding motility-associated C-terminal domain-containing protein, partial [Flavisolibacter sp.]|nr:gliding motility-associated C-terminal domain-containing protein [Flavisolibacter sp.]